MDYYSRTSGINTDGTPTFSNITDESNETYVIGEIEKKWNCKIYKFGKLCQVDFYAIRDERIVSVLELKSRTHESGKYPDVFLNFRKWLALTLASYGLGCPAIFIVKFTNGIYYTPISEIPVGFVDIGGTNKIVKSHTDIEPVFRVKIDLLKRL